MIVLLAAALASQNPAQDPAQDPAKTVAAVQAMYDQSCQVRAYGTYDDLCSALRKQLSDAKREEQRALKARPKTAPPTPAAEPETAKAAGPAPVAVNN